MSEDAINRCPQFACNDEKERASLDEKFRFSRWGGKLLPKHPSNFALIILSSASKFSSLGDWFVHGPLVSRFQQSFTRAHDYGRK